MKELVTSAYANKRLKDLNEKLDNLYLTEQQRMQYVKISGQYTPVPDYDFSSTRDKVQQLMTEIYELKHAINQFNTTTVVPEFNMTIDAVLVYMAGLTREKNRLASMMKMEREKVKDGFGSKSTTYVELMCTSFDPEEAAVSYEEINSKLQKLQLALDKVNSTVTFEIGSDE